MSSSLRRPRSALLIVFVLWSLAAATSAWGAGPRTTGALRVLWQQELPPYPSGPALDIRWASDSTILVAWAKEGVVELALDGKFSSVRWQIPDPEHRFRGFSILAASKEYVVGSSLYKAFAFRRRDREPDGLVTIAKAPVGIVEDLDLSGHELALLGNPTWAPSPKGVVAWLGPISDHPEQDLKPLPVYDAGMTAPDTWEHRTLGNCASLELGGIRFLPDGSLLVVPGFQAGAQLFSSGGRLLRSWDTQALGLDAPADCASMSAEQKSKLSVSVPARFAFLNEHRVLDDILPLPEGPGLLIRSVAGGTVHWELKVLQSGDRVLTYEVPVTGTSPYDRLRGDVRGNRIVLLRGAHGFDFTKKVPFDSTLVVVAELPQTGSKPKSDEKGGPQ